MGLKIDMAEINQQINSINAILKQKNESAYQLLNAIEVLQNDTTLKGDSYSTAKEYMRDVHMPIVKGIICANGEIIDGNQTFISRFEAQVDSLASARIDSDKLQELSASMDSLSNYIDSLKDIDMNYFQTMQSRMFETQKVMNHIEKLFDFNSNYAGIYDNAKQILDSIKVGLPMISQGIWDANTHRFSYPLSDMNWAKIVDINWKNNNEKLAKKEMDKITKKLPDITNDDVQQILELAKTNPNVELSPVLLNYLKKIRVLFFQMLEMMFLLLLLNKQGQN
jgi:hypothetical protein